MKAKAKKSGTPKDVDAYLARVPPEFRALLQKVRKAIHAAAPKAEETISYQMPMFKFHGMLVGIAAFKKHCSFFTASYQTLAKYKDEVKDFYAAKGTLRFTPEKPLPLALVKKLVKARVQENLERRP
jgi:uncharacterized protein YdhG (YjbR/CyaY superfamily)